MPTWYSDPALPLAAIFVLAGFWCLIKGADLLVEGAVVIAKDFGLSTAVIGATVVAFGTSLPELMVSGFSSLAALRQDMGGDPNGPAAIAVANVVGSNIFNIGAVMGAAAVLSQLPVARNSLRIDMPFLCIAGLALIAVSWPFNGVAEITRLEGVLIFAGLITFIIVALKNGVEIGGDDMPDTQGISKSKAIGLILIGILMLAVGGEISLTGALKIAASLGMSERVIGLTVMAIGTSLPELVTSVQAARKGHADMAVANVLGSGVFNIFCIIGVSSMIIPLPVNAGTLYWDFWWMLAFPLIPLPVMLWRRTVGRGTGFLLLSAIALYIGLLLAMPELGNPQPEEAEAVPTQLPAEVPADS